MSTSAKANAAYTMPRVRPVREVVSNCCTRSPVVVACQKPR
jgi:hypothetical protein